MAGRKDDATPASGDSGPPMAAPLLPGVRETVTVGELIEAFKKLPPETVVSLCVGPDYQDLAMRDAIYWSKHGCVFLLADEAEDDDEDEDDAIEGDWVEVPREEFDSSAAEPA